MALMPDLFLFVLGLNIFLIIFVLPGSFESTNTISKGSTRSINQFEQPGSKKDAKGTIYAINESCIKIRTDM